MEAETRFCCDCIFCLIGKRRVFTGFFGKNVYYCLYGIDKDEKPFEDMWEKSVKEFGTCEHFKAKYSVNYFYD